MTNKERERKILVRTIAANARTRPRQHPPGVKCIIVQPGRITRDEVNGMSVARMGQDHMWLNGVPVLTDGEKKYIGLYSKTAVEDYIRDKIIAPEDIPPEEQIAMEQHFFPHFCELPTVIAKITE